MAVDPSRLVDVRGVGPADPDGTAWEERGSGLLVTDDLILTAAHVVFDGDESLPVELHFPAQDLTVKGRVVWPEPRGDLDVALVRIIGPDRPTSIGRAPQWGRFTGREAAQGVDATGFPSVMNQGDLRVSYQVTGHINPQGALRQGRYLVSVHEAPANPGPGAPSPWGGMSGAIVVSGGVIVGVVVIDEPGFDRELLTAVPARAIADDPVARELLGMNRPLVSVELDPLLSRPVVGRGTLSPAQLLRADEEVIPFQGREEELADLTAWCMTDDEFGARLIAGPGGRGKTRLAQALVDEIERLDGQWISGLLSSGGSLTEDLSAVMSTAREHPVLLVADYAESRGPQLEGLLAGFEAAANPPKLRLLLLARAGGEWWKRLGDRHPDLLADAGFLSLPPLHPLYDRDSAFASSVDHFAARLVEIRPKVDWRTLAANIGPRDLHDERFGDPLALQLEALLGLLESAGDSAPKEAPELRLISHEREYWRNTLEAQHLDLTPTLRDQAVAAATLMAVRDRTQALDLLQRIPELGDPGPVATWLRSLYPTETHTRYWGPLQPDRLGEHHIGGVSLEDPTLLPHLLGSEDVDELQDALVIIGRAMAHQPHLEQQVGQLLSSGSAVLVEAAGRAADRLANPIYLTRSMPLSAAAQRYTLDPDDYGSDSSWGHSANVPERLSEIGRGMGENPFTSSNPYGATVAGPPEWDGPPGIRDLVEMGRHHEELATRAYEQGNLVLATMEFRAAVEAFRDPAVPRNHLPRTLLGLATALSDTRLFQEASAAADEAVSILRAERSADPQDQGVLGRALQVLGAITAEMGSVERALSYGYEAVSILRLADSGPDASAESHRDLGRALSNLAGLTQRTGRAEEAVAVSREAVSVLEELNASGQLAANDATYGRVILGHARIVATAQGPEGALEQVDRALAEFARIAATDPASERAMAPELASAYGLRSVVCAQLGLLTPALASGEQAVQGYSDLVDLRPGFNPDLARSLVHLAELRLQAGLAARAVADCQRAVDLLVGLLATSRGVSASVSSLNRDLANARDLLARSRAAVWGND